MPTLTKSRLPSLPLLAKELAEQSARPRTYIVRTLYALILYVVTLFGFYQQVAGKWQSGSLAMLGTGNLLFQQVLWSQGLAVFVVLPALMAGVVTSEKERDTLGLLLITKLSPWTIVVEKFLSRVIPMLLYLSLSLPLLGVAYSLGGVETIQVINVALHLFLAVLLVGTWSVLCSVWFRTTAQALVASYLGSLLLMVIGPNVLLIAWFFSQVRFSPTAAIPLPASITSMMLSNLAVLLIGGLITTFGLRLAAKVLWSRAFIQPKNRLLIFLRAIDRFFHQLNQNSVTKGIVLVNDRVELPEQKPITWKETQKRSMGTLRYLTRLLLMIEIPLLFGLLIPLTDNAAWDRGYRVIDLAAAIVWWIAVFAILASATGLISGERARQTLDVLLSTPMSARQIMREKFEGVRRLIWVLWIPLATVIGFRCWWLMHVTSWNQQFDPAFYLLQSIGSAVVYLPLVGWIGVHLSLRFRSQVAAMTAGLVIVLGVAGLPMLWFWLGGTSLNRVHWESPGMAILTIGFPWSSREFPRGAIELGYIYACLHFALYGAVWIWLRYWAAVDLSRRTGRCEYAEAVG